MHWIRQSSIYVYLTIATLLFLVFYSYFQFSEYKKFTQYVEQTHKVINSTDRLKGSISKLLAFRLGFIIEPTYELKELILQESKTRNALVDSLETDLGENSVHDNNLLQIKESILLYDLTFGHWFDTSAIGIPVDSMKSDIRKAMPHVEEALAKLDKVRQIEDNFLQMRSSLQKDTGQTVPFLLLITGLTAITMLVYSFYMMSVDLKERLAAKEVLEKNVFELHLANEELERFAFIASHNLKEPLRKARTFISRILHDTLPIEHNQGLQKVDLSLKRLQLMLDDLLDYTRLLQHDEKKELIDLNEVIKAVMAEFEEEICASATEINSENLPNVNGFPGQVTMVFRHLFSNALKYQAPEQQPVIAISSTFNDISGSQVIIFSDNGMGFDTTYNQKIFEVFGRLHAKDEYEGTGIGLAICRRAMFNHDGFITADSTLGEGATFSLYFPF